MLFAIIVLLEALAVSVAAHPIVISPDVSPDGSPDVAPERPYNWAPVFRHGKLPIAIDIKAGEEVTDEPDLQPRNEAALDALVLDTQDAGMSSQQHDKEITDVPLNDAPSIASRANKPSKSQIKADDKKFHRDQLKPNDAKYINNLDKLNAKKCGGGCQTSLDSQRSRNSKAQKVKEGQPKLPGSRASRHEVNTKQDDYNHDLNHLRQDRGDLGVNGQHSLDSWHSVESANSKASRAKKAAAKGGHHG
ncbi:hypothetical protein CGMCC3_g15919 [Colletotrichum fructicola]|uniref:Secreted protein n=1 Tax=Colletotrichum fructicola (strain Nara gc5) TaxID=1213859 RepID=L2G6I4_COLFN|nr:uncharacterized protein CGMCC3_g15919 [Colletotrichum fructicola]KAE9567939.1 hypothetical protein CGMCC3_g15919 [Colletotrichum fructicola]KAF4425678.1 hypothetical protein CFRS1_v000148 [Colletotrichum fructicola]KAF4489608.1 hypothetical protein CGGC5_v004353 [Colletotrichum fructicola Nara gc5]KAF4888245.1 hypothetical protein CGCFRS4_v010018 [Colletotrichum fructicola]